MTLTGAVIGNFRITQRIARGGMGEVWRAEHGTVGTPVAVKLLAPELSRDDAQVQRLFNEAVAVSRIRHPGIVQIFDVGRHEGRAFLIMELLEGELLSARIERAGRLPASIAAELGRQIGRVLGAAHDAGVTHRDLKPDNIFLVRDSETRTGERIKVLDFGIAKLTDDGLARTHGSGAMGTPRYMSPEQWRCSSDVDWRTDAYALGCVLFEMVAGRPPFTATSLAEAYEQHSFQPPPRLRDLAPDAPVALAALVDAMLAKDPAQRPRAMQEIVDVLALVSEAGPQALDRTLLPSPPRPRGRARLVVAVAGLAVPLLVVLLSWSAGAAGHLKEAPPDAAVAPDVRRGPPPDSPPVSPPRSAVHVETNRWVPISPPTPPMLLGVSDERAGEGVSGFRPSRQIRTPSAPFEIQAHEVTWKEWLPDGREDANGRGELPVTSIGWEAARAYCVRLGGSLPSEAQWELAARGGDGRPHPWGTARIDLARTHAFAGREGAPVPVMTSAQDVTPDGIYDLAGNVQEWTEDLWRDDVPGRDETWVARGETTFRSVRGLPMTALPPVVLPSITAAYRDRLCATGACVGKTTAALTHVGFRCVRPPSNSASR